LRYNLGQHEEEDGQRDQYVDTQRHLLVTVGGYVEDEDRDEGVRDEWDNEIDGVEEELPSNGDTEAPHRERLVGPRVVLEDLGSRRGHDVELDTLIELGQVNPIRHLGRDDLLTVVDWQFRRDDSKFFLRLCHVVDVDLSQDITATVTFTFTFSTICIVYKPG